MLATLIAMCRIINDYGLVMLRCSNELQGTKISQKYDSHDATSEGTVYVVVLLMLLGLSP